MVGVSVSAATASSSKLYHRRATTKPPAKKLLRGPTPTNLLYPLSFFSSSSSSQRTDGSFSVRAVDPQKQDQQQKDSNLTAFTSQEDLDYLWKLVGGSVIGGALIKYGSAVFPEITRPNLTLALLIILSPVFLSVLLLIYQSAKDKPN